MRLGMVLALLVGINIYVFFLRGGTSIEDVKKAARAASIEHAASTATPPGAAQPSSLLDEMTAKPANQEPAWTSQGQIKNGDSLGRVLRREGLSANKADQVIRALQPILDFRALRPGQGYRFSLGDDHALLRFELKTSPTSVYRVDGNDDGTVHAQKIKAHTELRVGTLTGTLQSSLWNAVRDAGESGELVALLTDLFAYDINFYIESRKGDTFRVIVEKQYLDNKFYRYGRVLAAEYRGKAGNVEAYWWKGAGSTPAGYFDANGKNIRRAMLKTPLKFARVSSGFNPRRMHPVLHRVKGHWGTDYAAPTGTPIWASAAGKVVFVGWRGGSGNAVVLRHGGGLTTIYMHMSRFAKGLRTGQTVKQKQVIGYVGATGLATGPHLHFGVKKNGKYVDSTRLQPPRLAPIPAGRLATFKAQVAPQIAALRALSAPE